MKLNPKLNKIHSNIIQHPIISAQLYTNQPKKIKHYHIHKLKHKHNFIPSQYLLKLTQIFQKHFQTVISIT